MVGWCFLWCHVSRSHRESVQAQLSLVVDFHGACIRERVVELASLEDFIYVTHASLTVTVVNIEYLSDVNVFANLFDGCL